MKAKQTLRAENISNGTWIDTPTLAERLAGGDDYIRARNGEVRGLALRLDLNPQAPNIVIVGKGPRIEERARLLVNTRGPVPAYAKRDTSAWEYLGEYSGTAYRTDIDTIKRYRADRLARDVAGILFLESANMVSVSVRGGGFADPLTRREVEQAAIDFVTATLERDGYDVYDHQRENRGYDLLAVSDRERLMIEVKGTDGPVPRFFISRGERLRSIELEWRLAVVTSARSQPALSMMTGAEAEARFNFDGLAWECTLKPEV